MVKYFTMKKTVINNCMSLIEQIELKKGYKRARVYLSAIFSFYPSLTVATTKILVVLFECTITGGKERLLCLF